MRMLQWGVRASGYDGPPTHLQLQQRAVAHVPANERPRALRTASLGEFRDRLQKGAHSDSFARQLARIARNCARVLACSRLNCVPVTCQPSSESDPSTGWHRRRRRNGTSNRY